MKTAILTVLLIVQLLAANAQQWQNVTPVNYSQITDFSFINPRQGWITSYKEISATEPQYLLYTGNAAQTFYERHTFNMNEHLVVFQMTDSMTGYGMLNKNNHFFFSCTRKNTTVMFGLSCSTGSSNIFQLVIQSCHMLVISFCIQRKQFFFLQNIKTYRIALQAGQPCQRSGQVPGVFNFRVPIIGMVHGSAGIYNKPY